MVSSIMLCDLFYKRSLLAADGLINFRNGQAKDRYTLTYTLEAMAVNCY